ncbi:vacuolar protein sorting-associated protein 16B [Anopheles arabiensis]|uniref:Vps16 C-terminal domain-containing protein n=1 Tax=Anopheles arabiensis TaxID=7173 RepID=A0A182HKC9_ANOAR|nr:vacuolar protein sorting-associated protein 16B [Anopheles arabiensis]XP_321923.6 vacuolar protein sorting-associated protein 16B [Anopheles gambiae]
MESKDDDYWNDSANKSFNFDEDDVAVLEIATNNKRTLFGEDTASEANYGTGQIELPLHTIISDENLELILQEQSRNEMTIPKGISLEEEVKLLRKKIQEFNYAPSTESVVRKLILGKPCSLEMFRSMAEKEQLLDEAIASGSGNAILKVTLFLDQTLKKKLFYTLLQTRPEAVYHYVNYLSLRLKVTECTDLLVFLGRHHEASLLQFSIFVCSTSNLDIKRQRLKKIYSDYFSQPGANSFYAQLVANYMNLLEYQMGELHSSGGGSKAVAIQDKSVLETLNYVCGKYKWGDTSLQTNDNPFKLSEYHQVSQAQFEWIALNERAKQQAWLDFDHIFERKAWLNLKQKSFKINIPIDRTILRLHALHAPDPVLNTFLAKVEDPQRRLALARKVQSKHGIVDALVLLKDRAELEAYRSTLDSGTEERLYAENALKSLNNKWKSDAMKLIK